MIHTCSDEDRHSEIIDYCRLRGLTIDSINKNPIELPFGNEGKPYYNWQLCDRSGLDHGVMILELAVEEVATLKAQKLNV